MRGNQQSGALQERLQRGARLVKRGLRQGLAGDQEDIGTRCEVRQEALHGGPQETFGAVTPDSHPDGFSRCHAYADFGLVAGLDNQDNKRMGIGLAKTPHPLEIG